MPNRGWTALRTRAERGPSANFIKLKDGENAKVRFLVREEDDVVFFRQHYVNNKYEICQDDTEDLTGECQFCDDGDKPGELYAFNVIDRSDGKVKILQLAIGHATQILEFYDEYEALNDRDYKITRRGNQSATRYTFVALKESPMDAADKKLYKERYDLEEHYKATKPEPVKKKTRVTDETKKTPPSKPTAKKKVEEEDYDEDEEEEETPKKKATTKAAAVNKKAPPPEDDDEEDDEEEDEDEEELEDEEDEEDEDEDEEDSDDDEEEEEDEEEDDEDFDLEDDD